jgi:hypothetical protein
MEPALGFSLRVRKLRGYPVINSLAVKGLRSVAFVRRTRGSAEVQATARQAGELCCDVTCFPASETLLDSLSDLEFRPEVVPARLLDALPPFAARPKIPCESTCRRDHPDGTVGSEHSRDALLHQFPRSTTTASL